MIKQEKKSWEIIEGYWININKILYEEHFGNWIYKETLHNLTTLFDLNWEFLWEYSDKEKVIDKETLKTKIMWIEGEIERRWKK